MCYGLSLSLYIHNKYVIHVIHIYLSLYIYIYIYMSIGGSSCRPAATSASSTPQCSATSSATGTWRATSAVIRAT